MMSGWTTLFFVLNTFIVMVIALNMLIAIVSDSYAQIRASKLFLRTRVELAAELVAIGAARSRAPSVAIDTLGRLLAPMKRVLQLTAEPADGEDGDDDGGGGDDDDDDGRSFPEHPSPIFHAPRDIISRKGKSLTPIIIVI